ncbi:MAG: chitobiase/beta-hexosaminidase C-terminal domain-containing protein [Candidatus Ventricola sp.]
MERRVQPEEAEKKHRRVQGDQARQGTVSSPERGTKPKKVQRRDVSGDSTVPVGLHKQVAREQMQVRHVRHAPDHIRRKVDAQPAMLQPPIYQKSHKRLRNVIFVILLLALFFCAGGAYMLFKTESGQEMMAQWGWDAASTSAYVTLGRQYVEQGYFSRALETLAVAVEREPENVDALILMAQAHTELGDPEAAKAIYLSLIEDIAPAHPSAYRSLIKIYQQEGYNAEALALMKRAEEATNASEFDVMLREYTPTAPTLSHTAGRYNTEIDVMITIPDNETVYYSTDGTDPSESGLIYQAGTKIHVSEGKMTIKAIGFTENGTPSEQVSADYTIVIPTPAAPKANVASGEYNYSPKVSLRPGEETYENPSPIVAIYYTLDGRSPTTESTLYNDDEPIQIPSGSTELRAISVAANGKVSYEMRVTYKVNSNLQKMFGSSDTFKNMELYSTGYNTFVKTWGTPESYEQLPADKGYSPDMESYEAVYSWGTARFVIKKAGGSPVLYALDTTNEKMTAPRTTRIGMSAKDVMAKFRDLNNPALDDQGNRLLYNYNSANLQFGTYKREADGSCAIHYYYPVGDKNEIFVELSYYLDENDNVTRIVWQRYLSEL